MLDWVPNADHVGIYQALSEGDFTQAGLDVHVQVPTDPATPLQLLAAGKVDIAISYEPEVMLARNRGLPLVSVAAIVQKPLTSIVSIGSKHIRRPRSCAARPSATPASPTSTPTCSTILAQAHVPASKVKEINVGANLVPAMLSGRVDATLGAYWNYEAIELAQRGKHPNVIRMEQVGVPTYDELVLVVRRAHDRDQGRASSAASSRRWRAATSRRGSDPTAAVDSLVRANPGLDRRSSSSRACPRPCRCSSRASGKPWGWQDPTRVERVRAVDARATT